MIDQAVQLEPAHAAEVHVDDETGALAAFLFVFGLIAGTAYEQADLFDLGAVVKGDHRRPPVAGPGFVGDSAQTPEIVP